MSDFSIPHECECCFNCTHYHQHYVVSRRDGYTTCFFGHCSFPRLKIRYPNQCCEHFKQRSEPA